METAKGTVFIWAEEEMTFEKGAPHRDSPTFNVVFKIWLQDVTPDEILKKIGGDRNKAWQLRLRDPAELFPSTGKIRIQYHFSFLVWSQRIKDEIIGLFIPCGIDSRQVANQLALFKYFGRSPKIESEKKIGDDFVALLLNNV